MMTLIEAIESVETSQTVVMGNKRGNRRKIKPLVNPLYIDSQGSDTGSNPVGTTSTYLSQEILWCLNSAYWILWTENSGFG